jgi:predicted nucleic acid-binding protein
MSDSLAVVDASITLQLVQAGSLREPCRAAIDDLMTAGTKLVAPMLWAYETTSALCRAVSTGRLTADEGRLALERLGALVVRLIGVSSDQNRRAFDWTLRLQRGAAYDSYYLALARELDCALWTTDARLARAVAEPWVHCIGLE